MIKIDLGLVLIIEYREIDKRKNRPDIFIIYHNHLEKVIARSQKFQRPLGHRVIGRFIAQRLNLDHHRVHVEITPDILRQDVNFPLPVLKRAKPIAFGLHDIRK